MANDTSRSINEQVCIVRDAASGLEGVVALHSSALGPAAGGCRFWHYADHRAMVDDALRLAEGMSYKNALAGLPLGGGKAVLRRPEGAFDRTALFRAFGRAVRDLDGRYVTAEDVGTTVADMQVVAGETRHVAGLPPMGLRPGGDPSPSTARGVFLAMRYAVEHRLHRDLSECTVAIQGVGHVGSALAHMLHAVGARLVVSDVSAENAARVATATGADVASVGSILSARVDVFAPCALGGIINHATIGKLAAKVVCGAANNQLAEAEDGDRLADRGVFYAPDYVVNAGGIINVAAEYLGWSLETATHRIERTPERLARVIAHGARRGLATNRAADDLARETIARSEPVACVAA